MAFKINKNIRSVRFVKDNSSNEESDMLFMNNNSIGNTFKGDDSLKEIEIHEGVNTISYGAFMDCTSLTTVILPSSLKRIEHDAFVGCTALQKFIIPDTLEEVDCWLNESENSKITLFEPSADELIKNLLKGFAMDLYFKDDYREDHWD